MIGNVLNPIDDNLAPLRPRHHPGSVGDLVLTDFGLDTRTYIVHYSTRCTPRLRRLSLGLVPDNLNSVDNLRLIKNAKFDRCVLQMAKVRPPKLISLRATWDMYSRNFSLVTNEEGDNDGRLHHGCHQPLSIAQIGTSVPHFWTKPTGSNSEDLILSNFLDHLDEKNERLNIPYIAFHQWK